MGEDDLVAEFRAAHQETVRLAAALADSRERRRALGARLHAAGRTYRWLGEQIGVSYHAVEGFLKYKQRNASKGKTS